MCLCTVKKQKLLKNFKFLKGNEFCLFFYNIFKNNFYMVKRELPAEKDTIFYLYVALHA